jgi:MFS family permease
MDPSRRRTAGSAAESWFLERGLPFVLTRRARWRRLWPRSAPILAAYGMLQVCILPIYLITGGHDVEITGEPTTSQLIVLAIIGLALPLMAIVGWLVSRSRSGRTRAGIATIAVVTVACVAATVGGATDLAQGAVVVAAVLILTGCGVGSVVGWAVRMMLSHLATVGALVVRALPVVLLTALVFFNTYVWLMAATISGNRLGLAMAFLVSIAAAFVISATRERVKPMLHSTAVLPNDPKDTERLADTPFATLPDAADCAPLKRAERLNVIFVLATSQLAQIVVVAVVTATIYLILGVIILDPSLLNEWTHTYKSTATVLGFTLPVPDSLIHMTLFLGALTFMYISARAAGDAEYRSTFLDPLIDDLHTTLIARNRYRSAVATACDVDATQGRD